jgi:uncharacterized protein (TIGR02679 family)
VDELDASDRDGRVRKRLEPGHRRAPPLDRAVVLLDQVVEVLVRANFDIPPAGVLAAEQPRLRRPLTWHVAHRDVFVCENPNIVAIAADRLGPSCAPLICTDGMPSAAQQTLLAQLAAGGAQLRYHGDFDWAGLVIGNFVMREFGAEPWRFGTADYLLATADHRIALRGDKPVVARWDDRLAGAMSERRVAVHEEGVVETLLKDLAANRPEFEKLPE